MLSRAASGHPVPSWEIVSQITRACEADQARARKLWKAARWARQDRLRQKRVHDGYRDFVTRYDDQLAMRPELIADFGQLRRAMVELRAKGGQPSLAQLHTRVGRTESGGHRLPRSSLSAILRGTAVPRQDHVKAFAQAMGVSAQRVVKWEKAWKRAEKAAAEPVRFPRPPRPLRPADGDRGPASGGHCSALGTLARRPRAVRLVRRVRQQALHRGVQAGRRPPARRAGLRVDADAGRTVVAGAPAAASTGWPHDLGPAHPRPPALRPPPVQADAGQGPAPGPAPRRSRGGRSRWLRAACPPGRTRRRSPGSVTGTVVSPSFPPRVPPCFQPRSVVDPV